LLKIGRAFVGLVLLSACGQVHEGKPRDPQEIDEAGAVGGFAADASVTSSENDSEDAAVPPSLDEDAGRTDDALDGGVRGPDARERDAVAPAAEGGNGSKDASALDATPDALVADAGLHSPEDASTPTNDAAPTQQTFPFNFSAISEAGGSACTIHRPQTLGENGLKHPVIVWSDGQPVGTFDPLLHRLAGAGFVVAAVSIPSQAGGQEIAACLSYVLERNRSGDWQGKIDPARVGVGGSLIGAAAALTAGTDPRFSALLLITPFLAALEADALSAQHAPALLVSLRDDLIAPAEDAQRVFTQAPVPILWATYSGRREFLPDGAASLAVAWFRSKLMDDPAATSSLSGVPCCDQANWTITRNERWTP
jgi:hypothetical protein